MYCIIIKNGVDSVDMRILICDDDELIVEQLQKFLKYFFKQEHLKCPDISVFYNGESLLEDRGEKDILFLDVEMPGMNGIYVGNELKKANSNIIIFIVTSFIEYLDEAMRFHVFRYLSKPLDKQRFFRNMKYAIDFYNSISFKIPVETRQGIFSMDASSIIAVEAIGRKVIVHTTSRDYESVHSMQYWQETLPKNRFFQTHRSYIVNFEHVKNFDHSLIHMGDDNFNAYLTKRKYTSFKKAYFLYLESAR